MSGNFCQIDEWMKKMDNKIEAEMSEGAVWWLSRLKNKNIYT